MKSSIIDTPKEINSRDQKITHKELYNAINKGSAHEDTVIKLYKEKEEEHTVIFSWQDRNKWKIDYPIQLHKIHKQRYVSHQQCLQLSEHIFNGYSLDDLKGFIDVPIRHFTLDEMLQFKKEDEMMLNGKDPDLYKPAPTPQSKPKVLEESKSNTVQKKITKPSIILGDISVPIEEPRTKYIQRVTSKKTKKTSPLKQFKESTQQSKKEKKQPSIAKTSTKSIPKKINKPKSIQNKTNDASLLNLGETKPPKKENTPSLAMGDQLGTDQSNTPTPSKVKTKPKGVKKSKPTTDDNSLFNI